MGQPPSYTTSGDTIGSSTPRAVGNLNNAGTAVVDDYAKAATNLCNKGVWAIHTFRMLVTSLI